jgi:hypothetical protein
MRAHECYHCKQWVEEGEAHDCWTTTEAALTEGLSEDLRGAWDRIREAAVELGDQRIYASHSSIMFSRKSCHFFVRPKRTCLELCIFLPRAVVSPKVRKTTASSKTKFAHLIRITHRDEVEPPITDWMREAWELTDPDGSTRRSRSSTRRSRSTTRKSRSTTRKSRSTTRKSRSTTRKSPTKRKSRTPRKSRTTRKE